MLHCQADDGLRAIQPTVLRPRQSDQQNPAVFWLSIRPTKHGPRKRTEVKRIARNEQLGLTSGSGEVHSPWPD
jgi:hypothetical protein